MLIGVPAESMAGETRVAATPETVKKLKAQGHTLRVEAGAGIAASVTDAAYEAAGAEITDAAGAWGAGDLERHCYRLPQPALPVLGPAARRHMDSPAGLRRIVDCDLEHLRAVGRHIPLRRLGQAGRLVRQLGHAHLPEPDLHASGRPRVHLGDLEPT